jgi:hypothetical protein
MLQSINSWTPVIADSSRSSYVTTMYCILTTAIWL